MCSRCRCQPASTPANAYCKSCRAAYQRAWRARRKGVEEAAAAVLAPPPVVRERLRGTPTRAEMVRYRLI